MTSVWTAIIEREDDGYVALCPELDIASQGSGVAEARDNLKETRDNLKEARGLFCETASGDELERRLHAEIYVTQIEVPVG